ncbi:MAG: hypothetical protein V1781_03370 [Bacteroidota bacterium]
MNTLKKLFLFGILSLFISPFFYSCGSNENESDAEGTDSTSTDSSQVKDKKAQNIFYAIPSPIELSLLIQRAGATYNKDLLNPIDNKDKYSTNISRSLNLGIYGADLSYTSVFDNNTQESILYLGCTRKLAESIGVGSAFDEKTINRIEANTGKKDSLLTIISDSYMNTDELLKENRRESASALVISGGFIEGLYLGTQLIKSSKNNADIIIRIAEQKGTLENVIALLTQYRSDAGITEVLTNMKSLKEIFDLVIVSNESSLSVKTNPTTKVINIGGKKKYSITPDVLEKLTVKIAEIRNKIINGQI